MKKILMVCRYIHSHAERGNERKIHFDENIEKVFDIIKERIT